MNQPTHDEKMKALAVDVFEEMRHRASEGCNGDHDESCCDPESERHPEDWCNRCLMGFAVKSVREGTDDGD
jgi:hypothetical protein